MKKKTAILALICTLVFLAGCAGCGSGGGSDTSRTVEDASDTMAQTNPGPQTGLPTTTVRVVADTQTLNVSTDVADTDQSRATGLMYVYQMPQDQGMLFVFDDEQLRSFWMKNTYIQLDMLFISGDGEIVDINKNAQVQSTTSYVSRAPAKYVLEVNGGWCDANGVQVGDTVLIDGY